MGYKLAGGILGSRRRSLVRSSLFAVCSLVVAAFAVNAYGQANPPGPANLDHFNCYLAKGPVQPQMALLRDQFDRATGRIEVVKDLRMALFCNPVEKTLTTGQSTPIRYPLDHLALYRIPPEPMVPRLVIVRNQFGLQTIVTRRAIMLAVPSGKSQITATTPPQLPPIPGKELDHFKCYGASGQALNVAVSLKDQFLSYTTKLFEPILFCNPVTKVVVFPGNVNANGAPAFSNAEITPIGNPTAHLTCYTQVPRDFQAVVFYNNQFVVPGTLPTVAIQDAEILCVPSLKVRWAPITFDTTVLTGPNG